MNTFKPINQFLSPSFLLFEPTGYLIEQIAIYSFNYSTIRPNFHVQRESFNLTSRLDWASIYYRIPRNLKMVSIFSPFIDKNPDVFYKFVENLIYYTDYACILWTKRDLDLLAEMKSDAIIDFIKNPTEFHILDTDDSEDQDIRTVPFAWSVFDIKKKLNEYIFAKIDEDTTGDDNEIDS